MFKIYSFKGNQINNKLPNKIVNFTQTQVEIINKFLDKDLLILPLGEVWKLGGGVLLLFPGLSESLS